MGLIFVLLLGEIDLSAGFTAGTSAAVLAVALTTWGWPWPLALLAGLLTGTVDRPDHRHARRPAGHPVVRRDAGHVPRPAGRHAARHRRGRHDPAAQRRPARDHEPEHAPVGRLAALGDRRRRLRAGLLAGHRGSPQGRPAVDRDLGVGGQDDRAGGPARRLRLPAQPAAADRARRARSPATRQPAVGLHPRHPGRAVGRARGPRPARGPHLRAQAAPPSAGTSTRSAATPRRRAAPASASRASRSPAS